MKKLAQKRRHQKREDFSLTDEEWKETLEYFNGECAYCGSEKNITFEHFLAFSKNGAFDKYNIIPACQSCNSSKRDKEFEDWYKKKDFYDISRYERIKSFVKWGEIYGGKEKQRGATDKN